MQMTVERESLAKLVAAAAGVTPARDSLPILSHLLLGSQGDGGFIQATDLDLEIKAPFDCELIEAGQAAIPARLLGDILKRLPAKAQIGLSCIDDQLKLVCGNSRFELAALPAEDFPGFVTARQKSWSFEIEARRLRSMLAGVRHAICTDESRYYLQGVYLHVAKDELTAVATNGHILALERMASPIGPNMPGIIIPRKTVGELIKLLPDSDDAVTLTIAGNFIQAEFADGRHLASRLVDGIYPDYFRVIPTDNPHIARLDAAKLLAALERVAPLCDADHSAVALAFTPGSPVIVTTERKAVGIACDQVEASITGGKALIGCNIRYLIAILGSLPGGALEIRYQGPADPLRLGLEEDEQRLAVLCPMRLGQQEAAISSKKAA